MSDRKPSFGLPAVILSLGLLAAAFVLGYQFKNLRQPGVITVKGLAEARHHATVGTWQVGVKIWGGSYADARTKSDSKIKRVKAFLQSHGFDAASFQSEDTDISSTPITTPTRKASATAAKTATMPNAPSSFPPRIWTNSKPRWPPFRICAPKTTA